MELVRSVRRARDDMDWTRYKAGPPPVLVKIAPDVRPPHPKAMHHAVSDTNTEW